MFCFSLPHKILLAFCKHPSPLYQKVFPSSLLCMTFETLAQLIILIQFIIMQFSCQTRNLIGAHFAMMTSDNEIHFCIAFDLDQRKKRLIGAFFFDAFTNHLQIMIVSFCHNTQFFRFAQNSWLANSQGRRSFMSTSIGL